MTADQKCIVTFFSYLLPELLTEPTKLGHISRKQNTLKIIAIKKWSKGSNSRLIFDKYLNMPFLKNQNFAIFGGIFGGSVDNFDRTSEKKNKMHFWSVVKVVL